MTTRRAVLVVLAMDAIGLWPFAYWAGYGHGDLKAMQMALYAAKGSAVPVYGQSFSFAWYWIAAILRDALSLPAQAFAGVVNTAAVLMSTCGDLLLMLVLATAVPLDVAVLATAFWRFTPEVWEVSTYAHPWTLALPIFFGAACVTVTSTRPASRWLGAVLFFAAFAMRADMILMVPVALALAYLHRRESLATMVFASAAGALAFLAAQQYISGSQLLYLVETSGGAVSLTRWILNVAIFGYGGGLAFAAALLTGGVWLWRQSNTRREIAVLTVALLPTLVLWIPHGGAARHFGPVYLVLALLLASVVATRFRTIAVRGIVAIGLVAANAALAEAALMGMARWPFDSVQTGEGRRVIERVPLGNIWSNHQAQVHINALENAYAEWALRCSAGGSPMMVGQESPYWLVMLAGVQYGNASLDGPGVYRFGGAAPRLWVVDIPESGSPSWWTTLPRPSPLAGGDVILLGPRLPGWLGRRWRQQHAGVAPAAADTVAGIEAHPCPAPGAIAETSRSRPD